MRGASSVRQQRARLGEAVAHFKHPRDHGIRAQTRVKFHGLRQLAAARGVRLGRIQVIPFIEDPRQAQVCFTGHRVRWIGQLLQDVTVGLGGRMKLVHSQLDAGHAMARPRQT